MYVRYGHIICDVHVGKVGFCISQAAFPQACVTFGHEKPISGLCSGNDSCSAMFKDFSFSLHQSTY